MPLVTATAGPPSVMAWPLTWVIVRLSPSTSDVIAEDVDRDRAVFGDREAVVLSDRRVVDRRHRAVDRRHGRDRAVGDRVGERGRAVVVRRRREHELARHELDRAIGDRDRRTTVGDGRAVDVRDGEASPSTSLSLPRTSTVIEPSSATVKLSF